MAKHGSLEEKVRRAKANKFSMPADVSCQKTLLPEGRWAYIFRHDRLGELGRLLILAHGNDQSQFLCEVAGEPDDPITQKRREILEPITRDILDKMALICGKGTGEPEPHTLSKQQHVIKSEWIPCCHCQTPTALLIFAPDAFTADRLEDYARLMYAKVKELNVLTWVVGAEKEVINNGDPVGESLILKIWPVREQAKIILSTEFNPQLDVLMQSHCYQ